MCIASSGSPRFFERKQIGEREKGRKGKKKLVQVGLGGCALSSRRRDFGLLPQTFLGKRKMNTEK